MNRIKLIVCADDRGGYLFHHRRVSFDKVVTEDILHSVGDENTLWMSPYTAGLFHEAEHLNICVDDACMSLAGLNDYCLIEENIDHNIWMNVQEIILYKWNRIYPYDTACPIEEIQKQFSMVHTEDLQGNSHQKITKEVYSR